MRRNGVAQTILADDQPLVGEGAQDAAEPGVVDETEEDGQ